MTVLVASVIAGSSHECGACLTGRIVSQCSVHKARFPLPEFFDTRQLGCQKMHPS